MSTAEHMEQVWNGMRRADATRKIGGDPARIMEARRDKGAWHGYLELHIEQGGTLERSKTAIGVVQGIVAIERYEAKITGFANHAGTTPMAERQDAMIAAAQLTMAVREAVTRLPGRQVGTVGKIEVSPNAPNVIAGSATLIIELRDLSPDTLRSIAEEIRARAAVIAIGDEDHDPDHTGKQQSAGVRRHRGPGCRRTHGEGARAFVGAAAVRRRPRRADDGAARTDGNDLRAERRRHQPFAEGADAVGRLRQRRERAAAGGAGARPGVTERPTAFTHNGHQDHEEHQERRPTHMFFFVLLVAWCSSCERPWPVQCALGVNININVRNADPRFRS